MREPKKLSGQEPSILKCVPHVACIPLCFGELHIALILFFLFHKVFHFLVLIYR
jgi:hypothetical protein